MPPLLSVVGPSSAVESRLADVERTVGFYLQQNEGPGQFSPWLLLPFPGLTSRAAAAQGPGRALWAQDGRMLRLVGLTLSEVFTDYSETARGTVAVDANPAQMASSGDAGVQVGISSGGNVYMFNLNTNVLSAAIGSLTAHQIAYLQGYFLGLNRSTSTIRISNLLDGLTWDPTQFVQRTTAPDRWQAILVAGQYVYAFGSETTDIFYLSGAFPFPFAIVPGALLLAGVAAAWSPATVNGVPIWLGQSGAGTLSLLRGTGTAQPTRISTHAFEKALRGYSTVSDAEGSSFNYSGHSFYKLNFPTAKACWVYDDLTGQLTEWPYWNATTGAEEASRGSHHCYAFGRHFIDDRTKGNLYTLDDGVWTDNGATRRWLRRFPFPRLSPDGFWVFGKWLEIFADVGIGNQNDPGSDPKLALRISRDGGNTWGLERTVSAGKVGKYLSRIRFRMLGRWRDGRGAAEIVMTDPVRWQISGGAWDVEVGAT